MTEQPPADGAAPHQAPGQAKKRTRVQFSCTACRSRKLKCDRAHPCNNCTKKGNASACHYVGRGPRPRGAHGATSPSSVQDRLQHLENLVLSLSQSKRAQNDITVATTTATHSAGVFNGTGPSAAAARNGHVSWPTPSSSSEPNGKSPLSDSAGKLLIDDEGTTYIDAANWRVILEEINGVRASLQQDNSDSSVEEESSDSSWAHASHPSPTLFFGIISAVGKQELVASVPPRDVTDRIISRYFNSNEPLVAIHHIPTFRKAYDHFWKNPSDVSLAWLALLFSAMTMTATICHRQGEPLPGSSQDTWGALCEYRKRSAQCLALSNYTSPGRYKIEALLLSAVAEFFVSEDSQVGVSYLLSLAVKLAWQMGYHRDPRHFKHISVLDAELRRRTWAVLCQLDTMVSFSVGVPKTIEPWQYDTELPRSLMDEDFDEHTKVLPPARPITDRTSVLYLISKSSLTSVFGRITNLAFSRTPVTYEEILEIDQRLQEAHDLLPPCFRMRPMSQSIGDPPDLIARRYTLDFLYQKARCVLHRKYLVEGRSNARYDFSRSACINAAKSILLDRADMYRESAPVGVLYRHQVYVNSLQNHDFLMAATIVCLELSYILSSANSAEAGKGAGSVQSDDSKELLSLLETSHSILGSNSHRSKDSQKTYDALTMMLQRMKGAAASAACQQSKNRSFNTRADSHLSRNDHLPPPYGTQPSEILPMPLSGPSTDTSGDPYSDSSSAFSSLGIIEGMLYAPSIVDWNLWDRQMRGLEFPNSDDPQYQDFGPDFDMAGYRS